MHPHSTAPPNAFTVDLEDWFQGLTSTNPQVERWPEFESRVVPSTRKLLKILHVHDVQATFFVLGHVADQHPDLIREIRDAGHEIGVHGYYHRFIHRMSPDEFLKELGAAVEAVQRAAGVDPFGHRAPYFSVNASTPWVFEYLAAAGIRYDSSVFPTRNMLYGYPGAPRFPYREKRSGIMEYPVSTYALGKLTLPVSGGFYVRALPYAIVRKALRRLNAAGQPAIMYIHPWELDLGQDYPNVTARERITHYHGRRGLEAKLHKLLSDFRFTSLESLMNEFDSPAAFAPETATSIDSRTASWKPC